MKCVSIVGSGWLACPLAQALSPSYTVTLSSTRPERVEALRLDGLQAECVQFKGARILAPISFFEADIIVVAIPPATSEDNSTSQQMKALQTYLLENSLQPKVVFVSSTSVFAEDQGSVTESTRPSAGGAAARELIKAEQILFSNATTILRLGGLVGPDRHPGRFLAGRQNVPRPEAPINLIHQQDAVGVLKQILDHDSWGEIYHGVCDDHRPRQEFYTQAARALGLSAPEFETTATPRPKLILNNKIKRWLKYSFIYPQLDQFLKPLG